MGRPEGPGCYCFANHALRATLGELADDYPYVVIDNEAGLENLSRRIVRKLDLMLMVSDPSQQGMNTVRRLFALAREMDIKVKQTVLVINRLRRDALPAGIEQLRAETGAAFICPLPDDAELGRLSEAGESLQNLSTANGVVAGLDLLLLVEGLPARNRTSIPAPLQK
jgi:CO dehydrogenase maturation factor